MIKIAVIPARGGSKRIPHKNIKDFLGKPLISYSINAALSSKLFDKVIVSTDDDEIAKVATSLGAQVPFVRDKKLSDDFTGTYAVTLDAYKKAKELYGDISHVCCIYATAPLLLAKHLTESFDLFVKKDADTLAAVCEFPFPIQRAFIENEKGYFQYREPQYAMSRSQDLPKTYQDCGLFYWYSKDNLENGKSEKFIGYNMPRHRVIDIDTKDDWDYACMLAKTVSELNLE